MDYSCSGLCLLGRKLHDAVGMVRGGWWWWWPGGYVGGGGGSDWPRGGGGQCPMGRKLL
mgnify:CR=1 FL=1